MSSYDLTKAKNEIVESKESKLELSENEYCLASISRVFIARLFDLILSSIPGLIMVWTIHVPVGDWGLMSVVLLSSLVIFILYFSIIPLFFKGNTFGKMIMKIQLVNQDAKKIKFSHLLIRETYFLYLPYLILLAGRMGAVAILMDSSTDDEQWIKISTIVNGVTQLVFVIWLTFVGLGIKMQSEQQAIVDIKFNLYVVMKKAKTYERQSKNSESILRTKKHVSLDEQQPGNLSKEIIKEFYKDETQQFDESINIEKPNFVENLKIDKKKKQIEHKDEDKK